MKMPLIKTATKSDEVNVIDVLRIAFSTDPAARWTWPEPHQFLIHFPQFVKAFAGQAFDLGSAFYVEGYSGAALWLPPNVNPDEDALIELFHRTTAGHIQKESAELMKKMGSYHPQEPHWYLPLIGVDPFMQGNGFGSALMKHALILCYRDNMPAYLESTNPRNIPLYERHGFKVLDTIQFGTSPQILPMLRKRKTEQ
jgi:ribosomal protein S18 acetylase RimI-like enzyme